MRKNQTLIFMAHFILIVIITGCTTTLSKDNPTQTAMIIEKPVTVEITRQVVLKETILSTIEVTRIVQVTATPQPTSTSEPEEIIEKSTILSGKYAWYGLNDGQGCALKVENTLSRVPPESVSKFSDKWISRIYFDLECCRGAPSYNLGNASGVILEQGNAAVYRYKNPIIDEECNLVFIFSENEVNVFQIGSDFACGFGGNVYVNGTYYRVDE